MVGWTIRLAFLLKVIRLVYPSRNIRPVDPYPRPDPRSRTGTLEATAQFTRKKNASRTELNSMTNTRDELN